eukprot:GHVS01075823.1.p1 GENE.GHVS01075823.1~~GHVS01075823.1.p1  ORF type:complete len:245 (+),score=44.14 GHVS01075823.1:111-845(+)
MSNVRSLDDYRKDEPTRKKNTDSFTGGEKSGLAVENPSQDGTPDSPWPELIRSSSPMPANSHRVRVYRNGFIVDDGPFRPTELPENKKFLKELEGGLAPRELQDSVGQAGQVHVALEDKRTEDFVPPSQPKYSLFSGEGHTTGNSSSSSGAPPVQLSATSTLQVDEAARTTTIQFRFHDGQRRSQQFNLTHTIADIHSFMMEVAPVTGEYKLLEGFPPREINSDPSTTIEAAGLLQAAITQKLC